MSDFNDTGHFGASDGFNLNELPGIDGEIILKICFK